MTLNIDWKAMIVAVLKAVWPFLAGGLGGLVTGCSVMGSGVGVTT